VVWAATESNDLFDSESTTITEGLALAAQEPFFNNGCRERTFPTRVGVGQETLADWSRCLGPASNGATELREQRYRGTVPADEERAVIVPALEQTGGALPQSAELLGMGRATLWRKLKLYGLTPTVTDEPELG